MANRRSVLIGLGGLVAGGGALLGTGAFTTVEAERTVSIETAGDADAFLGLDVDDDYDAGDGDIVQINLDGDAEADGEGLLLDATTTYEPILVVENNGTQDVQSLTVEVDDPVDGIDMSFDLHEEYEFDGDDGFAADSGDSISELPLGVGESAAFDLSVTTDSEEVDAGDDFDITVTITAEADE